MKGNYSNPTVVINCPLFFKANKILYISLYMNANCTLQAYQVNERAKYFITGNFNMSEDTVFIALAEITVM